MSTEIKNSTTIEWSGVGGELRAEIPDGAVVTALLDDGAVTPAKASADVYHRGNILGTVTQSGGVPTGAIVERDSNANGEYVRFADGTMICAKSVDATGSTGTSRGSLREYELVIGQYPSPFEEVFWVGAMPGGGTPLEFRSRSWGGKLNFADSATTLSVTEWGDFSWYSQDNYTVGSGFVRVVAVGRWF